VQDWCNARLAAFRACIGSLRSVLPSDDQLQAVPTGAVEHLRARAGETVGTWTRRRDTNGRVVTRTCPKTRGTTRSCPRRDRRTHPPRSRWRCSAAGGHPARSWSRRSVWREGTPSPDCSWRVRPTPSAAISSSPRLPASAPFRCRRAPRRYARQRPARFPRMPAGRLPPGWRRSGRRRRRSSRRRASEASSAAQDCAARLLLKAVDPPPDLAEAGPALEVVRGAFQAASDRDSGPPRCGAGGARRRALRGVGGPRHRARQERARPRRLPVALLGRLDAARESAGAPWPRAPRLRP